MRRVAIAGILAMQPDILVLDEPTAGLDPQGRKELMSLFKQLHLSGITIVLVTHLMDDVADYATAVNVMEKGRLVLFLKSQSLRYNCKKKVIALKVFLLQ